MSEPIQTEIYIGGDTSFVLAEKLRERICKDGMSTDWEDNSWNPETVDDLIDLAGLETLHLTDNQANYGNLPGLESFCKAHSLSYDLRSSAKGEFPELLRSFRPGLPLFEAECVNLVPVLGQVDVQSILSILKELYELETMQIETVFVRNRSAKCMSIIEKALGKDIPDITPFRVVGDK